MVDARLPARGFGHAVTVQAEKAVHGFSEGGAVLDEKDRLRHEAILYNLSVHAKYALLLRVVLGETLLLQVVHHPSAAQHPRGLGALFLIYGAAALGLFAAGRRKPLHPWINLWSFMLDIGVTSVVMWAGDLGATDFYVAYFLVILASCFLDRLILSFIVGGVASLVYAALAFPGSGAWLDPFYMLRVSMLLVSAFFAGYMADQSRRITGELTARFEERLAWMQRLSMVGRAMAGILHETKTPLASILINVESAREMLKRGGDVSEPLATIEEEAQRAAEILSDFLQFSRPADLAIKPVKAHELLRKVLDNARGRLKERGIALQFAPVELPEVAGSERHLVQVFTNLVNNAIDAMPLGGRLTVDVRSFRGKAEFRVADTGIGIPAERLPEIFEPFATSKGEQGGHGLGLSIARWIVEQHSGELRVESGGVNRGAAFTVELPLAPAASAGP